MIQQSPTIMVIEDEELLLKAITAKLERNDIHAIPFTSGKTAIEFLLQLHGVLPDAIWLDYSLKDMNGLEFMQEIKKHPQLTQIPVIVVSNSASPTKVHNMLALGAKKYILKAEHRLDDIITIINQFISLEG